MKNKFKEFWENHQKEIIFVLILFLASTISFVLGYLSAKEFNKVPIIIQKINN